MPFTVMIHWQKPEPRAEPEPMIGPLTAGQSRRLTSGGKAVTASELLLGQGRNDQDDWLQAERELEEARS
jgi:hypothetical protein